MNRLTNGFERKSDATLVQDTLQILSSMAGNQLFPLPKPDLAQVQNMVDAYRTLITEAATGDRLKVALKREKKAQLVTLLHRLADYVQFVAEGNRATMMASGFPLSKQMSPQPPITTPTNLRITQGKNPGQLHAEVNRVPSAIAYQFQYALEPVTESTIWESLSSSRCKVVIENLQSGKRYSNRVGVLGRNNQFLYSDPVSRIVQ